MKTGLKRFFFISLALVGFVFVLVLVDESNYESSYEPAGPPTQLSSPGLPVVSYIPVAAAQERLSIPVFGELKPKWHVLIKSQVNGEVRHLVSGIDAGVRVQSGALLAEIDKTRYQAQVDQAGLALEQAKLEHLQAEHKTSLALADWKHSGLKTEPSELMLFKPQLAIAERAIQSARSHYRLAQKSLSDTEIKAPFSGVMVERTFSQGQIVAEGETLFSLVDDQSLTLEVAIGEQQWSDLAKDWKGLLVNLYSSEKALLGQARLSRGGHVLNTESRQFRLFLDIPPELRSHARAGQFVHLELPGKQLERVLNLPESALTQDGTVWFIGDRNLLQEYTPEFYYRVAGRVLVSQPSVLPANRQTSESNQSWRIATRPLAFFLSGKSVAPMQHQTH